MSEAPPVCRHCGYFVHWLIPKAPDVPRWVHSRPYRPDAPQGPGELDPCKTPEPESSNVHEVWHHSTTALGLEPHHWMTCTCGWRLDPAPRSSTERDEIEQQHKAQR